MASNLVHYNGMIHGFFAMYATVEVGRHALDHAARAVHNALFS